MGDEDPYLMHGSLGPLSLTSPNGISVSSAVFAGLTRVSVTPIDTQTAERAIGIAVSVSVSTVGLYGAYLRSLWCAVKREKKSFQVPAKTVKVM